MAQVLCRISVVLPFPSTYNWRTACTITEVSTISYSTSINHTDNHCMRHSLQEVVDGDVRGLCEESGFDMFAIIRPLPLVSLDPLSSDESL